MLYQQYESFRRTLPEKRVDKKKKTVANEGSESNSKKKHNKAKQGKKKCSDKQMRQQRRRPISETCFFYVAWESARARSAHAH